jgi:GH3 auxin-responsive promoter
MAYKSALVRPFAHLIARDIKRWSAQAVTCQLKILEQLVQKGGKTQFGIAHKLHEVKTYDDFKAHVPVHDYEGLKSWFDRVKTGEPNVLWPGKPRYFAKTSGTTSGVKYIPLSRQSTPFHFNTARNALFNYHAKTGNGAWMDGNVIFLSGSPELEEVAGIPTGRLSGISNHLIPSWLKGNQLPSWDTNCIEDWETKLDAIVDETLGRDLRLISGIPPWVQMYYERLLERTGKATVCEIFPNFSVFVYGGVNFEPYRQKLEQLCGRPIDSVETYPASEGFIAFQDCFPSQGLLLNANAGIFFEFIPLAEAHLENPTRLHLGQVSTHVDYVLIINSNAGLWGYNIGDTIQFVSLDPPRLIVSGRVKHYISAFGEHVIGKEVESAMLEAAQKHQIHIVEYTVAPQVKPAEGGAAYHEWFVECDAPPAQPTAFAADLDTAMRLQNIYYDDLVAGGILKPVVIRFLQRDAFRNYMKSEGKLGGQNKVPRLSNDRKIADALVEYVL